MKICKQILQLSSPFWFPSPWFFQNFPVEPCWAFRISLALISSEGQYPQWRLWLSSQFALIVDWKICSEIQKLQMPWVIFLSLFSCYKSHFFLERQIFLTVQSRVATRNRGMWRAEFDFQTSFTVRVRLGAPVEWPVEATPGSVRLEPSVHPLVLRWGLELSAWLIIQTHNLTQQAGTLQIQLGVE